MRHWDVPIFVDEKAEASYNQIIEITSDIMQQKIRSLIDGRRHVKQIAQDAQMDFEIVILCV